MKETIRKLIIISLALILSFSSSALLWSVRADELTYVINGYASSDVTDSNGNAVPGIVFCLDASLHEPEGETFTRQVLSASASGYDEDTLILLRSLMYNYQNGALKVYLEQLGAGNPTAQKFYENYSAGIIQELVWGIAYKYNALAKHGGVYVEHNNISTEYRALAARVEVHPDYDEDEYGSYMNFDNINDQYSCYSAVLVPVYEWLRNNAPAADYDCYIYNCSDINVQPMIGYSLVDADEETVPSESSESSESSETAESSSESSAETTAETTAVTTTESASDETTVTSASSTDEGSSGGGTATVETTAASETSQTVQSVETTVPTETSVSTGSDTDVDSGNRGGDSDSSVPDTGESTSLSVYIGLGMMVASLPVLGESIRLKRIKRRRSYRR